MDVYLGLALSFTIIILGVLGNVFIGVPLAACWLLFSLIALKRGHTLKSILAMSVSTGKKAFVVIKILLLIGAVTGAWMASGTIPGIVYYSLRLIRPDTFLLFAFLICCAASFLLGSATGTASILGLPLIIIARSGNISLDLAAGAIIAGVFFGDRCSPMSSSAVLVSKLTGTDLFVNVRNMLRTCVIPLLSSVGFYYLLSIHNPVKMINIDLTNELAKAFRIEYLVLVPVLAILLPCLFRVKIEYSMLMGILAAAAAGIFIQGHKPLQVLYDILLGFHPGAGSPLRDIIKGGGVSSMLKTCLIVFTAFAYAGVLEGTKTFDSIIKLLAVKKTAPSSLFGLTALVGTLSAAFGCTQSMAVILTDQIMKGSYKKHEGLQFALHIENSCILTSALIPWNVAALLCTSILGVNMYGFIPYAFFLYILPLAYFIQLLLPTIAFCRILSHRHRRR